MKDELLLRRIGDVCRLCEKYHTPRFSGFLDEREQAEVSAAFYGCVMFGGYAGAERKIFGAFPEWCEPDNAEFPIKLLIFTKRYAKDLTHRHFLGTILSLGIDRAKIGDIVIDGDRTYVFVSEDIAEFIINGISKVAGVGVDIEVSDCADNFVPERRFEEISAVCASLRLDAVVASVLKISRSEAKAFITAGKAAVNHAETLNVDDIVKEGDLLSLRGFGRTEISQIGGKTRSDRLHITFKKYL